MSTEQRYGDAVWDAVCGLSWMQFEGVFNFVSVGEVSKRAGVTKPTAKKYLDKLYDMGRMSRMKLGNMWVYRRLLEVEE